MLLTPARLHRLQRDRDRGAPRWINFEQRINSVPDSPQRGFELALYSVVASDDARGTEAINWALLHPCERRQVALILNWTRQLASEDQRKQLVAANCPTAEAGRLQGLRDRYFRAVAFGEDDAFKPEPLKLKNLPEPAELYALIEYLSAYRTREGHDLRLDNSVFFQTLPALFLLTAPPEDLDRPSWQAHVAALALVSLDPNLEASQFLQSWALESRFLISDGPGVAYEFLWADPYLPGLGYENLQPWLYSDSEATLWARSSWTADACWIHIWPGHQDARNCPPGWERAPRRFGHLILNPLTTECYGAPRLAKDDEMIVRTPQPNAKLTETGSKSHTIFSDAAGLRLWQPNGFTSICPAR